MGCAKETTAQLVCSSGLRTIGSSCASETAPIYRPRHPERTGFYQIFEGQVRVTTPPDPRSGKTELVLDPLDWIHAVVQRPRSSWARLLHKIFEVDPLLCPKCQAEMKVVSVITEPETVDKILNHIARTGGRKPFFGAAAAS